MKRDHQKLCSRSSSAQYNLLRGLAGSWLLQRRVACRSLTREDSNACKDAALTTMGRYSRFGHVKGFGDVFSVLNTRLVRNPMLTTLPNFGDVWNNGFPEIS